MEEPSTDIACAFPTALDSPDHIALGYSHAWVYDTPHQSPDVWMTLALDTAKSGSG